MGRPVDSAIVRALGLDAEASRLAAHGGSGFASTFKLTTSRADGSPASYFVKTGTGRDAEVMFRGEPCLTCLPGIPPLPVRGHIARPP